MKHKSDKKTNNLKSIEEFDDHEFLNFLYAERERIRNKEANAGWTQWAIVCSIFALACFIYNVLKNSDEALNLSLCFYIFCVFFPIAMYFLFLYERIKAVGVGDNIHITRVRESKSKLILGFLMIISITLLATGFLLHVDCSVTRYFFVCLLVLLIAIGFLIYDADKLVTTFDMYIISKCKHANDVIMSLIGGTLILPSVCSMQHLKFGFSVEFECTVAGILIIILLYLLLRFFLYCNTGNNVDDLIDNYLFKGWSKQKTIRQLEVIFIGSRPVDEMMELYENLVDMIITMPQLEKKMLEASDQVKNVICPKLAEPYIKEMEDGLNFLTCYDDIFQRFLKKTQEIIDIGSTLKDEDFVAMIDSILRDKEMLDKTHEESCHIQVEINRIMISIKTSMQQCPLCNETCDKYEPSITQGKN